MEISERRPIAGVNLGLKERSAVLPLVEWVADILQLSGPGFWAQISQFVTCSIILSIVIRSTSARFSGVGRCYDSINRHIRLAVIRG